MVGELTGKRVLSLPSADIRKIMPLVNYQFIGSLIGTFCGDDSVVWGAGCLGNEHVIHGEYSKICAVRGPKTRERLLEAGIECPEVYGDPALLLPYVYMPQKKKKHVMTLIPHGINKDRIGQFVCDDRVEIIDLHHYSECGNWKCVIDTIFNSEFVVSSYMHGLIISEAYEIPSVWAQTSDWDFGGAFKWYDFYSSLGKSVEPIDVNANTTLEDLRILADRWRPGNIDLGLLIDACPDEEIKEILKIRYNEKKKSL